MVVIDQKSKVKSQNLRKSICLFCSMGCGTAFRAEGDEVTAIDYDKDNPINHGSLCVRGNYNFELLNHPQRLDSPMIAERRVGWQEAAAFVRQGLKEFSPDEIGIFLSSNSSNEDAVAAAQMAKSLRTHHICAAGSPFDQEAYIGSEWETPGSEISAIDEISKNEVLIIVGDLLRRAPVMSWRINQVKYGKKGNQIIAVDPNQTHTTWFATNHLVNRPGTEALILVSLIEIIARENGQGELGFDVDKYTKTMGVPVESLMKAARAFRSAASGTVIFVPGASKQRNDLICYLARLLASISQGKKFISFYGHGNTLGVNQVLSHMQEKRTTYAEMVEKIDRGELKALFLLGEDLASSHPEMAKKIRLSKLLVRSSFFKGGAVDDSTVTFPLASHMEERGTYSLADGRTEETMPIAPKTGGLTNAEIISVLLERPIELEAVRSEAKKTTAQGMRAQKVILDEKVKQALQIVPAEKAPAENITHFGNNALVNRFLWYRINNKA